MSREKSAAVVAVTALLVVGLLFPAGSAAGVFADGFDSGATDQQATTTDVSVEVGEQLSTVVETTSDDIRTEAESVGFEQRLAAANATERASLVAERAQELENRSLELREQYESLTEDYQQSEVTTNQYARQIATLSASATNVERSVSRLQKRASSLSAAERRAVGVTDDDLGEISSGINPLTGATASAVLGRFTGENSGEISIEAGDRIEVSVESDGERSRQFERPRDDDDSYTVNQSAALAIAEEQLSGGAEAWTLRGVSTDDGAYEFEFRYLGAGEGDAEVSVDGSSGTVFSLEESIEAPEEDDADDERDEDELDDLVLRVVSGDPVPGSNVTLQVLGNGEAVENATVRINEQTVGTTDSEGRLDVTFPESEEVEISATAGDADGELEFEFEDDDERELGATASIDGQTITVSVVRGGQPVEGATVTLNENATQTTDTDGRASFEFSVNELEITIQYEDQEAELEYELEDDETEREDGEDDSEEGEDDESEDSENDENEESEESDEQESDESDEDESDESNDEETDENDESDDDETEESDEEEADGSDDEESDDTDEETEDETEESDEEETDDEESDDSGDDEESDDS